MPQPHSAKHQSAIPTSAYGYPTSRDISCRRRLRWIIAARIPRVASANAPCSFDRTKDRTVLLDSLQCVFTACGVKSTLASKDWAQKDLIQPNDGNQDTGGNLNEDRPPSWFGIDLVVISRAHRLRTLSLQTPLEFFR